MSDIAYDYFCEEIREGEFVVFADTTTKDLLMGVVQYVTPALVIVEVEDSTKATHKPRHDQVITLSGMCKSEKKTVDTEPPPML